MLFTSWSLGCQEIIMLIWSDFQTVWYVTLQYTDALWLILCVSNWILDNIFNLTIPENLYKVFSNPIIYFLRSHNLQYRSINQLELYQNQSVRYIFVLLLFSIILWTFSSNLIFLWFFFHSANNKTGRL